MSGGRTVWIASFPKSGNTWIRAIITGLGTHPLLFGTNRLTSGSQPHHLGGALPIFGIDPRWFDRSELDRLRTSLVVHADRLDDSGPGGADQPLFRKTHEHHRAGPPGCEPFPRAATRAAILVTRDPRDVAVSFAAHFGLDLDRAIDAMAGRGGDLRASPANSSTAQPWGSWSSHARTWLDPTLPFPVHLVRYEDLQTDTVGTLLPVLAAVGLDVTSKRLAEAATQTRFERLRDDEARHGFRELGRRAERFFRTGTSGGWRDVLSPNQVAVIEADHAATMTRLGYEPVTDPSVRSAVGEARNSVRRRRRTGGRIAVDPELGLEVRHGTVPEMLDGAVAISDLIATTPTATVVHFDADHRLLVENGTQVTIQWPDHAAGSDDGSDLSWVVQGWAVVIAALQRGTISLHASTVRIGDETVAVAGHRGAGKSTTSMGLRRRGHALLVDDTTMIDLRDGRPHVVPYARNVHLLPDAAAALGVDFAGLAPLAGGRTKAAFLPEPPDPTPRPLDRVVILRRHRSLDGPTIADLGTERVAALAEHAVRSGLATAIVGHERFFDQIVRLAAATRVQVLSRPASGWTLDRVLDLIEAGGAPEVVP